MNDFSEEYVVYFNFNVWCLENNVDLPDVLIPHAQTPEEADEILDRLGHG